MEMLPMPPHLAGLADVIEQEETSAVLRLRCRCGCNLFHMERADYSPEERAAFQAYEDSCRAATRGYRVKWGTAGLVRKRGFFGRWEPVVCLPRPACCAVAAIRAVCDACGAIHLVFDNRLHGCKAACGGAVPPMDAKPLWTPVGDAAARGCQVEVTYPEDRFRFEEKHPGVDFDNAFDCVDITGRNAQGSLEPILSAYA